MANEEGFCLAYMRVYATCPRRAGYGNDCARCDIYATIIRPLRESEGLAKKTETAVVGK